jgi:hypothetical protein
LFTEGNFGCDCNLHIFFHQAGGEPQPEGVECGEMLYRVDLSRLKESYEESDP